MSFHDPQYSEKRDFIRMQVETSAILHLPGSGEKLNVQCQDLSSQGVQILCHKALPAGTDVSLSIPSPTPHLPGLQARGKVIRCQGTADGQFSIGIQFDSLN